MIRPPTDPSGTPATAGGLLTIVPATQPLVWLLLPSRFLLYLNAKVFDPECLCYVFNGVRIDIGFIDTITKGPYPTQWIRIRCKDENGFCMMETARGSPFTELVDKWETEMIGWDMNEALVIRRNALLNCAGQLRAVMALSDKHRPGDHWRY